MKLSVENLESIKDSIQSALYLLNNEIQCVEDDDLYIEYESVIQKLQEAEELLQ